MPEDLATEGTVSGEWRHRLLTDAWAGAFQVTSFDDHIEPQAMDSEPTPLPDISLLALALVLHRQ